MKRAESRSLHSCPLGIRIDVDLSALSSAPPRQDAPGMGLDIPVIVEDVEQPDDTGGQPLQRPRGQSSDSSEVLDVPITFDPRPVASGSISRGSSPALAPGAPAGDPLATGQMIASRYRVLRRLGTGGMGVVYACAHAFLDRTVALKVVRNEGKADTQAVTRLFQEARLAAQVQSPHVVQVLDCGCLPDGSPYVAMELLEGRDLLSVLRQRGPLAPERVIEYMLQACSGLAQAHGHDIVHRDLKPENLIVSTLPDGVECIKIIDFGISERLAPRGQRSGAAPRSSVGSPNYMSPEQIATPDRVDARTDVWSLGVVMYELLVGCPPFTGATADDVCLSVLVSPAPDPRLRRPNVPAHLVDVVLRCLEKHPARRFQSAEALGNALREARDRMTHEHTRSGPSGGSACGASHAGRASGRTRHSGSWLRALAPMLTGAVALFLTAAAQAERPDNGADTALKTAAPL